MGSGTNTHGALAADVGRLLAELDVNLLTGGGPGVMEAASRAFVAARRGRGICIGIIPCRDDDATQPKDGYPNQFVELAIRTHLPLSGEHGQDPLSRNHINILSSDALVFLPGQAGTVAEAALAVRYRRPAIIYSPDPAAVRAFPDQLPRAVRIAEVRDFLRGQLRRTDAASSGMPLPRGE